MEQKVEWNKETNTLILNRSSASLEMKESANKHKLISPKLRTGYSTLAKKKLCYEIKNQMNIKRNNVRMKQNKNLKNDYKLIRNIIGTQCLRKKLVRAMDVRYLKQISKFINKYSNLYCDPNMCQAIDKRHAHHKLECQNRHSNTDSKMFREQGVTVSPSVTQSKLCSAKCTPTLVDIESQTTIILTDNIAVPLRKCSTRVIEPKRNIYKEHLKNEIINWLQSVPIFYSLDFTAKYLKSNIAAMLVERIDRISNHQGKDIYERMVKNIISECLNKLPMWLPNRKQDQSVYKINLRDRLYQRIIELNSNFQVASFDKEIEELEINNRIENKNNLDIVNDKYVKEVIDWLDKIMFSEPISSQEILYSIKNLISSILYKPVQTRNSKLILQDKIIEILEELPIYSNYVENRGVYLNQFAEDLTNRLFGVKIELESPIEQVSYNDDNTPIQQCTSRMLASPKYNDKIRQRVRERVEKALQKEKITERNHIKAEICKVILNSFETLLSGTDRNVTSKISEILLRKCDITKDKALLLAQKIKCFVRIGLLKGDTKEKLNNPLISSPLLGIMSVYRSTDCIPEIATPKPFNELEREESFVARGTNILEDQISAWMTEHSLEICICDSKSNRDKMVKTLALTLQDPLRNNNTEDVIKSDIRQWLNVVIKPEKKEHIGLLTQNLKEKVIEISQDKYLQATNKIEKLQHPELCQNIQIKSKSNNLYSSPDDCDKTMKEIIFKYVEYKYDSDDPLAKDVFSHLLVTELRRLNRSKGIEIYESFENGSCHKPFRPEIFNRELEYIKMISDWLRNIPLTPLYNRRGNRSRIDFIIQLANKIQEREDEHCNEMDYNIMTSSIINESIRTYNLPILPEHSDNVHLMVDQLLCKVKANRTQIYHNLPRISSHSEETSLSNFLEEYITMEGREIADDEIKLEVWITRVLKEVKKLLNKNSDLSTKTEVELHNIFSQNAIPEDLTLKYFGLQMSCAKEISDWLKNIPILPIVSVTGIQKERIRAIAELAAKLAEREILKNDSVNDNTAEKNLVEYITNWISRLPLDTHKNIVLPVLVQQLMNRIERIYTDKYNNSETPKEINLNIRKRDSEIIYKKTLTSIKRDSENIKQGSMNNINPSLKIVEFIENWCNNLPLKEGDCMTRPIKADIARKLYQKIGEFTIDPTKYHNEILFKELLEDEVDILFENLRQSSKLYDNYDKLKSELITTILDIKKALERKCAGANYKRKLVTTLNASIPNPVRSKEVIEPGFEMYKNYLANMFILENFDHSNEDVKSGYERRIKHEIDKYFASVQNKNALPLNKEQIYNELYSELFIVPIPIEECVMDEVEEIKTRCEIDTWFENLPVKTVDDIIEKLEWDQILSVLTKKIQYIEKNESEPDEKIRKEIKKCLLKFPLLPEYKEYLNEYIDKLVIILKSSAEKRKYRAPVSKSLKGKNITKNKCKLCVKKISRKASNSNGEIKISSSKNATVTSQLSPVSYKSPEDLMEEIVRNWCNILPWIGNQPQIKTVQNDTVTKIMIKLFELSMDLDVFNDDMIYNHLLDEELEKIMSNLHLFCDFGQSTMARKLQLKEMIKCVKHLMKKEKSRYEYKTELNKVVENILNDHNNTAGNVVKFNDLREEIVNNFVLYIYNKEDYIMQQQYKGNLLDAVIKYVSEVKDKGDQIDPLIRRNQLLCELSKIPIPCETALQEEVEEIEMRNKIEQLFEENGLNDNTEKTAQIKKTLTKRLNDIEKSGHTKLNDTKMNTSVAKCINKLGKKVSSKIVEHFVNSLKDNEAERKTHPFVEIKENNYKSEPQSLDTPRVSTPCSSCQYETTDFTPKTEFEGLYHVDQTDKFHAAHIPRGTRSQRCTDGQQGPNSIQYRLCQNFGPVVPHNITTKNQLSEPLNNMKLRSNEHWSVYRSGVANGRQNSNFANVNFEGDYVFTSHTELPNITINQSQDGSSISERQTFRFINNIAAETNARMHSQAQPIELSCPTVVAPDSCFQFPRQMCNSLQLTERFPNDSAQFSSQILFERDVPLRPLKRRSKYSRQMNINDDGKYRCTCVKKPKCICGPYCFVLKDEHCYECGGFRPRRCRLSLPEFFY